MRPPAPHTAPSRARVRAAIALTLAVPFVMMALAAFMIWSNEQQSAKAGRDRLTSAVRVAAAGMEAELNSVLDQLEAFDRQLGLDPSLFQERVFAGAGQQRLGVSAFSRDGMLFTRVRGQQSNSIANDPDFQALAAGEPWRITPLIPASTAGLPLFAVGWRLERDGQFAGAVVAYLPADVLSRYWRSVDLGKDSTMSLVRTDGWIVTRYPVPEKSLNLSNTPLFTTHLKAAPNGIYTSEASPMDGQPRIVAYLKMDKLPLVAIAGMSKVEISESFRERMWASIGILLPFAIGLFAICGWMVILLQREARSGVALQKALNENKVLLQEIHHRVKNNLHAVSALVRLQNIPKDARDDLTRRINAMSAVHQHMYEADQFASLDAADYLERLLASQRENTPPNIRIESDIEHVRLNPDAALPLGLLVSECLINAFKHAFPNGREGIVRVKLARAGADAVLTISDNGVGDTDLKADGLGRRLIRGFAGQLRGDMTVSSEDGVTVQVKFKPGAVSAVETVV